MITSLFRTMLKINGKLMLYMGLGSFLLIVSYVKLFPTIANQDMNKLLQSMPKGVLKAFNLSEGITSLNGFLVSEYYSMIYLILLIVFSTLTANHLVARLVDRGSMAYLVSTPNSRLRIITTQATVLLMGLLFICLCITLGGLIGNAWLLDKSMLDIKMFLKINLVGFLTFAVICGYSFLSSCFFDDERTSVSVSAGLTIVFLILDIIGKVSEDLTWIRNCSLFHAFDPAQIMQGDVNVIPLSVGLGIATLVLFFVAGMVFKKKDLPV